MEFKPPKDLCLNDNVAENWRIFKQKFQIFLEANEYNEKPEQVKIAMLLNAVGEEALQLYNTFVLTEQQSKKYSEVLQAFEEYCTPRSSVVFNRFKFFKRSQEEGESFDHFQTDLKKLAKTCEFLDQENSLIRDRIIIGICNQGLQEKLIRETDITLEKTIAYCRAAELSKQQVQVLNDQSVVATVKKYNKKVESFNNNTKKGCSEKEYICKKCGYTHEPRQCPAYGKICNKCKKVNHFAIGCRVKSNNYNKSNDNRRKINKNIRQIEQDEETEDDEEDIQLVSQIKVINNISQANNKNDWTHNIKINDTGVVNFKIDTGADVNVLPFDVYNKYCVDVPTKPSKVKLVAYDGSKISTVGSAYLKCLPEDREEQRIKFIIVKTQSNPIIGLKTATDLNLIKRVQQCETEKNTVLTKYKQVFNGLGKLPFKYQIQLKEDARPTVRPARRLAEVIKNKLKPVLINLEKNTIITKVTQPTEWVNDLIIVEKKNGSIRVCLNPVELNKYIKREHYNIPTIEELKMKLAGKNIFSVLDMKDGFHQIQLEEESSKLCTFATPFGRYKFNRLPFGLVSSPEVFQRENERIFGDISGVQIYFDDIIISGSNETEHDLIFAEVMNRALKNSVKFNIEKIQYKVSEVTYLGFIFSQNGIGPDSKQVEAITRMPEPRDKKELQRFLGMVTYLHSFIPSLSEVTSPLRIMLKGNTNWSWNKVQQDSFNTLKKLVSNAPTLKFFDPKVKIVIQTDASQNGIGCCILQNNQPIAYASRALSDAEKRYPIIEKELLGIVFACSRFHQFIYGHRIEIHTDHKPLVNIIIKDIHKSTNRIQRLKLKIIKYALDVKYIPGKFMYLADHLSRSFVNDKVNDDPEMTEVIHSISLSEYLSLSVKQMDQIRVETAKDHVLTKVLDYVDTYWSEYKSKEKNHSPHLSNYYKLRDKITKNEDILFFDEKIIIPYTLRKSILSKGHSKAHFGMVKCKLRLRKMYYWPSLNKDVEKYVNKCKICEKFQRSSRKEPLINQEIPEYPFVKICMDIAEYAKNKYLVVVDYLSKWIEIIPIKTNAISDIKDKLLILFSTHGIPKNIVADNSPFNSIEFREFSNKYGIELKFSSPYYPRSNGLAEKGVGIAKQIIKKSQNYGEITEALLDYRSTPVSGTSYSPSQILMGRLIRTTLPMRKDLLEPKLVYLNAYDQLQMINEKTKDYHDRNVRIKPDLNIGDNVTIQDARTKLWQPGKVVDVKDQPRSYVLENDRGKAIVRNSIHIRKSVNVPNIVNLDSYDEPDRMLENRYVPIDNTSNDDIPTSQQMLSVPNYNKVITRSGRIVQKPARYNDFT